MRGEHNGGGEVPWVYNSRNQLAGAVMTDQQTDSNKDAAADCLVAVLAVLIPVVAVIFWLSGLPVS